ncbi:2Fe-2S ferredoxin [Glutamicibacter mysorens]|uniref:2Fe-2S ferredoxin n=1 Tax=Glutamicibacter mysorens TaxID=257984 RepID=A0ABX4N1B3_9MICC|nr:2Fe-2S iron-sulfur cluster-binding protein [Glutamicibacter mysorens]PJJ45423.1 2Fe-2S ferredoxin [Glutamicibacter mysorens]
MPTITFTQNDGTSQEVEVAEGTSVMRAALSNSIAGIVGECGGQAMCATCHVHIRPEFATQLPPLSDDEDEMLDCTSTPRTETSRLGCQVTLGGDLPHVAVDIPAGQI